MKPTQPEPPHDPAKDLVAYEKLPVKAKELLNLQEQITRATGEEREALQKKAKE